MKNIKISLCSLLRQMFFLFVAALLFVAAGSLQAKEPSFTGELVVVEDYSHPVIGMDHTDVLASNNRTGFETGQVVVQDGVYFMFVGEMFDKERQHVW